MTTGKRGAAGFTTGDIRWLFGICTSRGCFTLVFTCYSAAIPLLMQEWNMSASRAGLVQSAWHTGYLISLFVVGFLSDRFGAKQVFLVSSIASSATAMMFAFFANDFWSAALLYGLTGLFSGGSYTPGLTLISERFGPATRGSAMGFYLAGATIGYAVSLALTGVVTPYWGWRGAFIVNCTGPMIGLLIALRALRGTPNLIHRHPDEAAEKKKGNPVTTVLKNKPVMLSTWAYTFHSWEHLGMKAWLPAFFAAAAHVAGMGITEAASLGAVLTAITYVTSSGGSIAGGWISDRYGRTASMLLMSCTSVVCSFTLGWFISIPLWLLTCIAAFYSFTAVADSGVYSTSITELVPPRQLGATYSVRSVFGFGAGAVSPWVFGMVLDAVRSSAGSSEQLAWAAAWSSLGLAGLLCPIAVMRLRRMPEALKMAHGKR